MCIKKKRRIIITPGEPAGVGLDIVVLISQYHWSVELVVCCSKASLYDRALKLGIPLILREYLSTAEPQPQIAGTLTILDVKTQEPVKIGTLCINNSQYVINTLIRASIGCMKGEFDAMVTGPVHKGIINEYGISFTGHTEFLAKYSGVKKVVMMLQNETLRVALATTHIPIKKVSRFITRRSLKEIIHIIYKDLKNKFSILNPSIFVCGLNPHCGENGYIGNEEIKIINPVITEMRDKYGINITGPLSADTIFQPKYLKKADIILSMYHDQGLTVLKYQGFNKSINVTLGLPFIRTSVDHGTALELAGLGNVNINSFFKAIELAVKLIK